MTRGDPQGRCETTQTERFEYADCKCGTYPDNLGPCKTFDTGANVERCVYCDHAIECHLGVLAYRGQRLDGSELAVITYVLRDVPGSGYWIDIYANEQCEHSVGPFVTERGREVAYQELLQMVRDMGGEDVPLKKN